MLIRGSWRLDDRRRGSRIAVTVLSLVPLFACGDEAGPTALPTALARGAAYETTLHLQTPLVNRDGIDRVVYRWSTDSTSRDISMADVVDLEVKLYAATVNVYTDSVRVGGTYQPIGGVTRSGLTWDFDFRLAVLTQMNNVLNPQQDQSTGTRYLIADNVSLQDDNDVVLRRTTNGGQVYVARETLANQMTVVVR